jgi:DHA1 family multidrug resistance protein-like MFS transporter
MSDLIREAPLGQLLRYATKNQLFPYPEELPGFEIPETYKAALKPIKRPRSQRQLNGEAGSQSFETQLTPDLQPCDQDIEHQSTLSGQTTQQLTHERLDADIQVTIERVASEPIYPVKTADGVVLVDWYSEDDPANPHNWSPGKKLWVGFLICLYTFVVYTGSAIYTSSIPQVIEKFHITAVEASLPLSLYVLAYGIGPLIFSPLSEIPRIGRSPVYLITMIIFTIVSLPTALVNNFAGLLVLRFLQGFFGSPCLATGAATMSDMVSMLYLPYALIAWVSAAYCGPALGPLLSGFAVEAKGWRWSLWIIFWAACPIVILMFTVLPETSTPNILLRKAKRLRKLTGESRLMAQSEIDQAKLSTREVAVDALIKPMEITIKDPAILFVNVYTAIIYGIYYSFFEVFPLVFPVFYGFSLGTIGVLFTCILIACLIGVLVYSAYLHFYMIPDILKNGLRAQEHRLVPALFACFGPTIGLFIFAVSPSHRSNRHTS